MSAGLAKLLDKAFVLGFALPAVLFLIALAFVFGCPDQVCGEPAHQTAYAITQLATAVLLVYVIAIILQVLNFWIYRVLEGYTAPLTWTRLKAIHQEHLQSCLDAIAQLSPEDAIAATADLRKAYPQDPDDLLPTKFGNAIRAFELYSYDVWQADAIALWPRLLTVLSKDVRTQIDDAKSLVDLWVNLTVLAFSLGLLSFALSICAAHQIHTPFAHAPKVGQTWLTVAIVAFVLSYVAYVLATWSVPDWGEQVKSAFDCYLPALAKQLGYTMPSIPSVRRAFWQGICQQLLFHAPYEPADVDRSRSAHWREVVAGVAAAHGESSSEADDEPAEPPAGGGDVGDSNDDRDGGDAEDDGDDDDTASDDDPPRVGTDV